MTRMLDLKQNTERLFFPFVNDGGLIENFLNGQGIADMFNRENTINPAFDISETEEEYMLTGEIPGIDAKDLDISLSDSVLTVKGEKKKEKEEKNKNYYCTERYYGAFERSFHIPEAVKTDELNATYNNGILKLTLPKSETSKVKKIEVKKG